MKKVNRITKLTLLLIISTSAFFLMNNLVQAESLADKIKKSMKETEERKQEIEQLNIELNQKLKDNGYYAGISISGKDFPFGQLNVNITVRDKKYKKENEKQIKILTEEVLNHYKLDNIVINIEGQSDEFAERSEEDKKLEEQFDKIFSIAEKTLAKKHYRIATMSIDTGLSQPNIIIEIADNKKLYGKVKKNLEKRIHDQIYTEFNIDYNITINEKTKEKMREDKWHPIFISIAEEVNKQFDEVKGFAHSFHPDPLQIIIKTSIPKGQQEAEALIKKIEAYVHEIIKIKKEELSLEREPYQIIIRSKEQEKLN